MKNLGLANYTSIITRQFKDLVTTYINPIPEFWNTHVLTPLYQSRYRNGLTFSLISNVQEPVVNMGLGKGIRFSEYMEVTLGTNEQSDIELTKSDGSKIKYVYESSDIDQSRAVYYYINKETNSMISIDYNYPINLIVHLKTHENVRYDFSGKNDKFLVVNKVNVNQERITYTYDNQNRIIEIKNNAKKEEKLTIDYDEGNIVIRAFKTNINNEFEEVKYIRITLNPNSTFNNYIKEIVVTPNINSTIKQKHIEYSYTLVGEGFVTYKIKDRLSNMYVQFEITPTLKPKYYQDELGRIININNDNPYCATIIDYRGNSTIYHSDKDGNLICVSKGAKEVVNSTLYDDLHRKLVVSNIISYNPALNGKLLEPTRIYCNNMHATKESIATPDFLSTYYKESKCYRLNIANRIGKYYQVYEVEGKKFDVYSLGIWLYIKEYSNENTNLAINIYLTNDADTFYMDNVAVCHSIKVKAKYIPVDYEYYMTMAYAKEAYKYIVIEVEEVEGEELTCEFVIDLYKNGLATLNDFDENNNIIEKIKGNNVKEYVYNIDNTISSSVSVNYEYDYHGNIVKSVDGCGTENLYEYDDSNNLLRYEMKTKTNSIIGKSEYLEEEVVKNVNTVNGIETHFEYSPAYILTEEKKPNISNKTMYNKYEYYGEDYELLKKKTYLKADKEPVNNISYDYDEARLLTTIDCNNNTMKYNNEYDEYLRLAHFKVNGNNFVSFTYNTYNGYKTDLVKTVQMGNKDLNEYSYDRYGRLVDVYYKENINSNATLKYEYTYDELDRIIKIEDKDNETVYEMEYDTDRNLSAYYFKINDGVYPLISDYNLEIREAYDKDQRLILSKYNIGRDTFNTSTQSIFKESTNSFDYYKYQIRSTKDLLLCMFDDIFIKEKNIDSSSVNIDESEYPDTRLLLINNRFQYKAINSKDYNRYCKLDGMLNYYEADGSHSINFDFPLDDILGNRQSIAMSFKANGKQSDAKLISIVDEVHELNVINSENKIFIQYVFHDETDIKNTLFTSSYEVVDGEYHFMCLTYDFDNNKIILKVNDRSDEIIFNKEMDRIIGLDFVDCFKGEITNIIIPKENIISDEDYEKYFKSFNLLLAINESRKNDGEIIKVSSKEILPDLGNQTFIPLNNGTSGIKENEVIYPIFDDIVDLPCIGSTNTEFVFNNKIEKYAYYAMGQMLVYKTNLSDTGTITLKYNLLHKDEENILFELKSANNYNMTLSIKKGEFVLKVETVSYTFKVNETIDELNQWNTITLAWDRMVSSASIATKLYHINVFFNGTKLNVDNYSIIAFNIFEDLRLYVGRNSDENNKYGNCFNGLIESLVYSNMFLIEDTNYKKINNIDAIFHKYNSLNLLNERVIVNDGKEVSTNKYSYIKLDSENNRIGLLVSEEKIGVTNYSYTYDKRGNIIQIAKNGNVISSYEFDTLGRLVYENNNGSIMRYSFDSNGNILEIQDKDRKVIHTYNYDKGLLVSFAGTNIEYDGDNTLNPIKIGNNITLKYKCRNLVAYDDVEKNIHNKYSYNQNNCRVKKEVFDEYGESIDTIHFYYDMNNRLIHQRTRNYKLTFLYDELNEIYGFMYNDNNYYYIKDILGTIKGITTEDGILLVSYEYDVWGNVNIILDQSNKDLGNINPIRYRGYYYDKDINMYYCQSRYYVLEWRRWLNADNPDYLSQDDINNLNLFVYCGNNPVMCSDKSGYMPEWLETGLAILGFVVGSASVSTTNDICMIKEKQVYVDKGKTNSENVHIENSYKIITPWVMYGYSFYLNHINPDSKDVIQGSTVGVYYEWQLHNFAAWLGIGGDSAKDLDVGKSIFTDGQSHPLIDDNGEITLEGVMSLFMRGTYIMLNNPIYWVWDLIVNGGF